MNHLRKLWLRLLALFSGAPLVGFTKSGVPMYAIGGGAIGKAATYDLTAGVKLDVEDFVYIISPTDVPFLGTYNGTDVPAGPERSILPRGTAEQKKVEWPEEELLTPRTTLGATAVTADTFITVASGARERFVTGDVVRIGDEFLRVTGYGTTADTLTTTRGFGDSSAAQQNNASAVVGTGTALAEGSTPAEHRFKDRSKIHNFTQIFGPLAVKVTGTQEHIVQYGVVSEFDHQSANRTREMFVGVEQAIVYGQREEDTTNEWRTMGGFFFYITTNVDSTTTDLTESKLLDQLQNSYDQGGVVDVIATSPKQKRKINGFNAAQIRLDRADVGRGQVVSEYDSEFGTAACVKNRHMRGTDLLGLEKQWTEVGTLRPATNEVLAKTGDFIESQILCEKTLKVRMEKRHFKFSALT